jgi:murein L,D-transpeptidase YafK
MKGKETIESRVESLKDKVYSNLIPEFNRLGLEDIPSELSILAFKEERILEVYARVNDKWQLLKSYDYTNFSGELGPKLKEGDKQIPEGIYKIEYLNPNSVYYLSLKVSYPNEFDKQKAQIEGRDKLGGDIFIHGKDLTVGCIPLGDDAIEEIFILATQVKNKDINVIIAPLDFRKNDKNPTIEFIDWEEELYDLIKAELKNY